MAQFGGPKVVKKLHFDNTAKDKLTIGINKIADAVSSTLGAGGKNVVIEDDFGNPHVTKDGVTVANSIMLMDPVENLGVSMMKQAAQQTANMAGDGTTTSIVLTQAIIDCYDKLKGKEFSFRDIKNGINKFKDHILKSLEKKSIDVDDKKLNDVSVISANNDIELGTLIADAFRKAGENGIVAMETSSTNDTYVDTVEGTKLNSYSKTPHFYTNKEKEEPAGKLGTGDFDRDGRDEIFEFATGSDPTEIELSSPILTSFDQGPKETLFFTLTLILQIGADEIDIELQSSTDLKNWISGESVQYLGRINNGNGTTSAQFRSTSPVSTSASQFIQFIISEKRL